MAKTVAVNHIWRDDEGAAPIEAPVLDLVHLSRQTFGDHALETELLTLFDRQAGHFAERLRGPSSVDDARGRIELTHMMKGSASAVGAFGVARAAEAYEAALRAGGLHAAGCETLLGEIDKARAAIAELV